VLQHVLANVGRRHSALPVGDFEGHAAIAAADVPYNAEGNLLRLELDCRIVKISADEPLRVVNCVARIPLDHLLGLGARQDLFFVGQEAHHAWNKWGRDFGVGGEVVDDFDGGNATLLPTDAHNRVGSAKVNSN